MINTIMRLEKLARSFSTYSPQYRFKYNSHLIPHPSKAGKGGEDALFADDNLLVVADGVGGWAAHGIDPGLYSKKLCRLIEDIYMKNKQEYFDNPGALIPKAVQLNKETGTTTVCILALHPITGKLSAAYIGDSVFSLYRKDQDYRLFFQAEENQREFNFPYQVGTEGDNPSESIKKDFPSNIGDLLVVGTDGLWDNL